MNHSRNMSNGRNLFNRSYESVKRFPTFGQKKFFQALCAKCRDAGIEPSRSCLTSRKTLQSLLFMGSVPMNALNTIFVRETMRTIG